jgi:CBS domain-containing protein
VEVKELLTIKGSDIVSVGPGTSVKEAAQLLKEKQIGSVIVRQRDGTVVGLVSERDIVRCITEQDGRGAVEQPVSEIMTRNLMVCDPDSAVEALIMDMTKHRIRHLPVMDGNQLIGLVSVGDLLNLRIAELEDGGLSRLEGLFKKKGLRPLRPEDSS